MDHSPAPAPAPAPVQPNSDPAGRKGTNPRSVSGPVCAVIGALVVGGFLMWAARAETEQRHERESLARNMANISGAQPCALAWRKAGGVPGTNGRMPADAEPDIVLAGPPVVMDCPMEAGGKPAAPIRVLVRCSDLDLRCVEPTL